MENNIPNETINNHYLIKPWNQHYGPNLSSLSKKATFTGLKKVLLALLWVLVSLSVFCFLATLLFWLVSGGG